MSVPYRDDPLGKRVEELAKSVSGHAEVATAALDEVRLHVRQQSRRWFWVTAWRIATLAWLVGLSVYAAKATWVEQVPPDPAQEERRHAVTRRQDEHLCRNVCIEHHRQYIAAACTWRPGGMRACDCACTNSDEELAVPRSSLRAVETIVIWESR